jgi:hypothetical protein
MGCRYKIELDGNFILCGTTIYSPIIFDPAEIPWDRYVELDKGMNWRTIYIVFPNAKK